MSCARPILALGLAVLLSPAAAAQQATLEPVKDNTLYESATGALSNGAGQHMFCGRTSIMGGFSLRRAVMAFDIAGSIPAGATIDSVTLRLNMSATIVGPQRCTLHALTADWGEGASVAPGEQGAGGLAAPGDATWIHTFHDTQFWANPGGDFDPAELAATDVGSFGFYEWGPTPELTALVQDWLDNPAGNFGMILIGTESPIMATAKRFDTREHPDPAVRPILRIEYTDDCYPDCDNTGTLDFFDFLCFQNRFLAGDPWADCDGTGTLDFFDFLCFQNAFLAGCP